MSNEVAQYVFPLMEFALAMAGLWTLYLTVSTLKRYPTAKSVAGVWKLFALVATYSLGAVCTLTLAVALGEHGMAALLLVMMLPTLLTFLGLALALRATKRARGGSGAQETELVVIKKIAPGRIRGYDDGEPVYLDEEAAADLIGAKGRVRMLPLQQAISTPLGVEPPLFGFWNDEDGTAVLLYKDDVLGVAGAAA